MIELLRAVVVMTIAGSVLALVLFAIKPLIKHRLPKTAQYYLWLVVLAALLLPTSWFVTLPQNPNILFFPGAITGAVEWSVILHETTHLRRKDVFVKWLSVFACAVHWFNPLVWLTRREIDRACELACDIAAIDTAALTPVTPLDIKDSYEYNFAEACYSADKLIGLIRKMHVDVINDASISVDDDYFEQTGSRLPTVQVVLKDRVTLEMYRLADFQRFSFSWFANGKGAANDTIAPWEAEWNAENTVTLPIDTLFDVRTSQHSAQGEAKGNYRIYKEDGGIVEESSHHFQLPHSLLDTS